MRVFNSNFEFSEKMDSYFQIVHRIFGSGFTISPNDLLDATLIVEILDLLPENKNFNILSKVISFQKWFYSF